MGRASKESELETGDVAQKYDGGKTLEDIAQEMGVSPSTISRRLKKWRESGAKGIEDDEEKLESAVVLSLVRSVLKDEKVAAKVGEIAGADLATIQNIITRIYRKEATTDEVFTIVSSVEGLFRGYMQGRRAAATVHGDAEELGELRERVARLEKERESLKKQLKQQEEDDSE